MLPETEYRMGNVIAHNNDAEGRVEKTVQDKESTLETKMQFISDI